MRYWAALVQRVCGKLFGTEGKSQKAQCSPLEWSGSLDSGLHGALWSREKDVTSNKIKGYCCGVKYVNVF